MPSGSTTSSSSAPRPSPLLQLLKEVPGYSNPGRSTTTNATTIGDAQAQALPSSRTSSRGSKSQKLARNGGEGGQSEASDRMFPVAVSKLVGRRRQAMGLGGSGVNNTAAAVVAPSEATTMTMTAEIPITKSTSTASQRRQVSRGYPQPPSASEVSATLDHRASTPSALRVSKTRRASSKQRTGNTPGSKPTSPSSYNHLPDIKRPSLSSELRRRVLVNASIQKFLPETAGYATPNRRNVLDGVLSQQKQQHRVTGRSSPAPTPHGLRVPSRTRKPRVRIPVFKEKETGAQDLTGLVKGMCHTMEESMVREKLEQFLKNEAREEKENQIATMGKINTPNKGKQAVRGVKPSLPDFQAVDFTTAGASTRNLREHLKSGKISHKREVLERAYGWESRFLDDSEIEEQVGRSVNVADMGDEDSGIVPIGESATASERGLDAVKVAGSVRSKASPLNSANSNYNHNHNHNHNHNKNKNNSNNNSGSNNRSSSGNDWVDDDDPQNANEDTIIQPNGIVRKGAVKVFRLDQSKIPSTPIQKPKRQSTTATNQISLRKQNTNLALAPSTSNIALPPPPPSQQPLAGDATACASQITLACGAKRSLQRFETVQDWLDHQSDRNRQDRHVHIAKQSKAEKLTDLQTLKPSQSGKLGLHNPPPTPSVALFERKYALSLAHLPYIKHTLKPSGREMKGGSMTISPRTDADPLGYIHLDLKGKRYTYTIIPGGKGTPKTGRRTIVILHPRYPGADDVDRTYEISELPVKHLSVLKLANKFVNIVRRGTVIMRIEGQPGHGSNPIIPTASLKSRTKWEWYRGEAFADGRFEFTVVPRGGFASSQAAYHDGETENSIKNVGGMVRIVFSNGATNPSPKTPTDGIIPRFNIPSGAAGKFKRVYAEISRAPSFSFSQPSIHPDVVWAGLVELGYSSNGAIANIISGETSFPEACGGFAEEVDWARRAWIECRRLSKGI